ncbi:MAG: NAD-dependent epimerase/dehydratase family protein [bacterium]|nr:NAD-dependent epimerase/dehydratase family protein [bacterium]
MDNKTASKLDPIIQEDLNHIIDSLGKVFGALAGQTILVTGANGFLASYLVDTVLSLNRTLLLEKPARVIALTRRPIEQNNRLVQHIGNPNLVFLKGDVAQSFEIPTGIDYIIHAASLASPNDYFIRPIDTINANTLGTKILLDYAVKNPLKGFLFVSSAEIYGNPDIHHIPIKEDYFGNVNPIGPRSVYQEAKRFGETLCYTFWKSFGVPVKIVRCFHTYGPRMSLNDGRAIPDYMKKGFKGEDIELGDGRDFIRTYAYVADTITAFWRVLLLGRSGEAYNVGSEEEVTIKDMAQLFVNIFDNAIKVRVIEKNNSLNIVDAPQKTTPDISKLRNELKYSPRINSLEQGLRRLKNWYELYG